MKKFLAFPFLVFALVFTSCTRSISTPPPPTAVKPAAVAVSTATVDSTKEALENALAAQATQLALAISGLPTQTPTLTPTPELVFTDIDPQDTKKQEDARWVVAKDEMRPCKADPLSFCPDKAATRGELAIAVGRFCIWEEIAEPIGYFTDLRLVVPAGASQQLREQIEKEKLTAAYSEALKRLDLYLWRTQSRPTLSQSGLPLTMDEYNAWTKLAFESPMCRPQPTPSPTVGQ
ncbi:MAG: hypothetical protein UY56_C0006G0002 [Parcubacteria group bacterium GW2011_GWA1_50_14]|nr:MAG: hypothetical protein UY56_C0006G0002 [Parcubacteria group bacterium GW2011_GWA1_50_14]